MGQFCRNHGEKHITREALKYYDSPDEHCLCFIAYSDEPNTPPIIGISAGRIDPGGLQHSITVTHKDFRNQGVGTELLRMKIAATTEIYQAIVASDNGPSVRICQKAELLEVDRMKRTRSSGEYDAILFREKEVNT